MPSPFELSYKRPWNSQLINLLILGVALQTLAQCLDTYLFGSKINTTLFLNLNLEDWLADYIEKALCGFVMISTLLFLGLRQRFLLWIPAVWSLALAAATYIQHASFGYELTIGAHLARILLPIGLYFLMENRSPTDKLGLALLRIGIASTFIFHGIEALRLKPIFVDYLLEMTDILLGFEMVESTAYNWLYFIGALDIWLGIVALFARSIKTFIYMAFWGAATALCRYLYHGDLGILPMLMRSAHWSIPLFLTLAYAKKQYKTRAFWRLEIFSPPKAQGSEI